MPRRASVFICGFRLGTKALASSALLGARLPTVAISNSFRPRVISALGGGGCGSAHKAHGPVHGKARVRDAAGPLADALSDALGVLHCRVGEAHALHVRVRLLKHAVWPCVHTRNNTVSSRTEDDGDRKRAAVWGTHCVLVVLVASPLPVSVASLLSSTSLTSATIMHLASSLSVRKSGGVPGEGVLSALGLAGQRGRPKAPLTHLDPSAAWTRPPHPAAWARRRSSAPGRARVWHCQRGAAAATDGAFAEALAISRHHLKLAQKTRQLLQERSARKRAMKFHQLGSSDLNVSNVCLGTMTWGNQNTEGVCPAGSQAQAWCPAGSDSTVALVVFSRPAQRKHTSSWTPSSRWVATSSTLPR